MPVRMKDIAQDLNVSVVTVSKVLRNHSDISTATRERVLQRMKELNYRPNLAARTLVTGRTYMIGLVVPDLVHPFFAEIARMVSRKIRSKGYSLVIASSEGDPELERQEIDSLLARQVDALVIASAQSQGESFTGIRVPLVLIDRKLDGFKANFVAVDDEKVGLIATEHLIECGYKRIAHISGPLLSPGTKRMAGYLKALGLHGREAVSEWIVPSRTVDDDGEIAGYRAMQTLIGLTPRPDAVFCFNDPTAIGALKAIFDASLRVPADIAVIGVGNFRYADLLRVPLSTVDQGNSVIGERAAKLALKLIESKTQPSPKSILLNPSLVVRESTRRN